MFKEIIFFFSLYSFFQIKKLCIPKLINDKKKRREYFNYINDCKRNKYYNVTKTYTDYPYLSVCLPVFNMEKYVRNALLSILNQSFQNFEIIIVNDNSYDKTVKILKKYSSDDRRIKIINHSTNKGVYYSRIDSILNAKGEFILYMDPDDIYLTKDLFLNLFNYNSKYNLDIIEFSVFHQKEGRRSIYSPKSHLSNHFHNFSKQFIYQPELSTILFNIPNRNKSSFTICRNVWNKLIKKDILLKMYQYIGKSYLNEYIIRADDMLMNIIINHFARNYSNINYPGYLYNLRSVSMSRGEGGTELKTIRTQNILHYFQIFYKYIKQFDKNRTFIFNEIRRLIKYIYYTKDLHLTVQAKNIKDLLNDIINDVYSDIYFKIYAHKLLLFLEEEEI